MNPCFGSHHSFIKLAFVALVLLCGYPSLPVSCFMLSRVRVWVYNSIAPDTDMTIHCKSKDDDLGEHTIPFKGNFTWKFHDNWDQTTLFWCRIGYWDVKAEKLVSGAFDIYKESRDNLVCYGICPRWVRTDGIYMWDQLRHTLKLGYTWPN
ncbi:hypothetical protein C5167_018016 [Papaver somniferum]|uniref:S-protein homolog n=1 Tax=Papaver somniferum TaxID=3469 RepID=A0A4Y7IPF5_PAPSO|nr:hypothetical protein C5167_018016 [Papaver somniferum]